VGERDKATHHLEVALGIASSFGWDEALFWVHYWLAWLFFDECGFDDAHAHIERAKSHTTNSVYNFGYATEMQARIWYEQHRLEEAKTEALRAADVYERLGATKDMEDCRTLLGDIQEELNAAAASD
jgi:tetratricopeptide (TPR) repeat protein